MKGIDHMLWGMMISCSLSLGLLQFNAGSSTGTISGQLVDESGQPIPHAEITATPLAFFRRGKGARANANTDREGKFQIEGLDAAPYTITAVAPGYVLEAKDHPQRQPRFYYLGDLATLTMRKGGVITGRVLDAAGRPIPGIIVRAVRSYDEEGRLVDPYSTESTDSAIVSRQTDDRGIYRLYGLAPGGYLVSAGHSGISTRPTPFDGRMLIYYPSAARAAAMKVAVHSGEEASGIDIQYRYETGSMLSGAVMGLPASRAEVGPPASVFLHQAGTDDAIVVAPISLNNQSGYAFYGLPNGDYDVSVRYESMSEDVSYASSRRHVSIKGQNVSGVDLVLSPLARISGRMILEHIPPSDKSDDGRRPQISEIALSARLENSKEKGRALIPSPRPHIGDIASDGTFSIRGLSAGRHRLIALLPDDTLFVNSIMSKVEDLGRNGVFLKSGERLTEIRLLIATGAARLKGKVVIADGVGAPERILLHLVPAETESRGNALRYAETIIDRDGVFSFTNLAPGRYKLFAQPLLNTRAVEDSSPPVAWDPVDRAKLDRTAAAIGDDIELKRSGRIDGYTLFYRK